MATSVPRSGRSRLFAVLFSIVLPLSTIAAWGVSTVTNTDRWVSTLHPLATNKTITDYIAREGASTLIIKLDVKNRIAKALPKGARFLATTITTELQNTVATALGAALNTQTFQSIWDSENRFTHDTAVKILEGRADGTVSTARSVILDITPTIISAINSLDAQGITVLDPLKKTIKHDRLLILRLLNEHEIQRAQYYFRLATSLQWALPFLMLLLALGVLFTAQPRRSGARRLALSVLLSSAVTYGMLRIAIAVAAPLAPTPPEVTKAILEAVSSFLAAELLWLAAIGALGLAFHWFIGEGLLAARMRHQLGGTLHTLGRVGMSRSQDLARVDWRVWAADNEVRVRNYLQTADVVVVVLAVVALLTWIGSLTQLLLVAVLLGIWYFVSRRMHDRLSGGDDSDAITPP